MLALSKFLDLNIAMNEGTPEELTLAESLEQQRAVARNLGSLGLVTNG